jgi:hypothetical protein
VASGHTIGAVYSGDPNFATSTGTLAQAVNQDATATSLGSSANPSVSGQDVTFTATVTASAPGSGTPSGTVQFQIDGSNFGSPVSLVGGVVTSVATSTLSVSGHTIAAVYSGDPNFSTSTGTLTQAVNPAAADVLIVSGFPTSNTAGAPESFSVTVQDAFGNTVTDYLGTIHFSSSDSLATLPADYTFTAADHGVHTFSALFETAGNQSLTVTDTLNASITGTQSAIAITSAAADHFAVAPGVTTTVAGTPFDVTVTVQDAYGNTVTGYTGTMAFSSADPYGPGLPAGYTFTTDDGGIHTFAGGASLYTSGTWDVTVTDTANSGLSGSVNLFVIPASPDHFLVTPSVTTTVAGTPFDVTVTVQDAYGNTVTGYAGTVTFSSADPYGASLPATYSFTAADNGVHLFAGGSTLYTAGTWDVTATDAVNSGLSGSVNLFDTPASPDNFLVTPSLSTTVAGTPFDVTVTVQDAYGNTVTGYTGTVAFSSADPYGAALPADYAFTADDGGIHTFAGGATLYTSGTWDVTVTDTANAGLTGSIMVLVTPAAASHFVILVPSSITAGTPFDITIEALDPYGNVDTNYVTDPSGVVHLSTTDPDPGVVLPGDFQFTAADQGIITFSSAGILFTLGDQMLMAMDTASGLADDGTAVVTVTAPGGSLPPGGGAASSRKLPPTASPSAVSSGALAAPALSASILTLAHAGPGNAAFVDQLFAAEAEDAERGPSRFPQRLTSSRESSLIPVFAEDASFGTASDFLGPQAGL